MLVLTFGFTLLTTDIAIGRRTKQNALNAFGAINKKWKFLGYLTFLVPALIMTYYSVIGGWVTKYVVTYLTFNGKDAAQDTYFTSFITSNVSPVVFMLIFLAITAFIVYRCVEKGIEKFSKLVMPGLILMIIPAVYVFSGTEGMASGPSLMFVSLPKVFEAMGGAGQIIGLVFFIMVAFAALTSCISIMETLVANCMEIFGQTRKKVSLAIGIISAAAATIICLGYNVFYFEMKLPNGQTAQLLDLMDYISNSFLMPFISFLTCIFVGWIIKPQWIIDEMESTGHTFNRKKLYAFVIRYLAPVMMGVLFLQSAGCF